MRTAHLDEAIAAVSSVYCQHTVQVLGREKTINATLETQRTALQPLVELSYGVPVKIDAGNFSRLFLMMHCANGSASTQQEGKVAEWRRGQTMPFSAEAETRLWFDKSFVQRGLRLDLGTLEDQCRKWLGHPLDQPLRFALRPFSPDLEQIWQNALTYLLKIGNSADLSPAVKGAFDEFLLTALLHHHPHNYSEELAGTAPSPVPSIVYRAERFIVDNADSPITVSDVAEHLGVSLRTLQSGFRTWRNSTPSAYLRHVRLRCARDELTRCEATTDVTQVALKYGFSHLGRFSAYYRSTFGELPSETARRRKFRL